MEIKAGDIVTYLRDENLKFYEVIEIDKSRLSSMCYHISLINASHITYWVKSEDIELILKGEDVRKVACSSVRAMASLISIGLKQRLKMLNLNKEAFECAGCKKMMSVGDHYYRLTHNPYCPDCFSKNRYAILESQAKKFDNDHPLLIIDESEAF